MYHFLSVEPLRASLPERGAYDAHSAQGIQRCRPGSSHHGNPLKVVELGKTHLDRETFQDYLDSLHEVYKPEKYHLLDFNCNT